MPNAIAQDDLIHCLLDECRGVCIPQTFAKNFDMDAWNVAKENVDILLRGPLNGLYWEAWDEVLQSAFFIVLGDGQCAPGKWSLYQNGDLFIVHEDYNMEGI